MVGLSIEIAWKVLISIMIVGSFASLFDQLLTFGESDFQTFIVLSFYVYCVISLFTTSRHKLFHVLAVPVFAQFIHLFQKYSFSAGANSVWRLMPFLILEAYFILFFISKSNPLHPGERYFLTVWIIVQSFFLLISPNFENIAFAGILFFLLILPSYYIYLKSASQAIDFRENLKMYFFILFIILGVGTFGLVAAGASYRGSDNLLATRNITDTNVTMAYFILLWPLVLLHTAKDSLNGLVRLGCLAIFVCIVIFSFSRGAVILVLPYLLITIFMTKTRLHLASASLLFILTILCIPKLTLLLQDFDMAYFWTLRFGEITGSKSIFARLQQSSGRAEIHAFAHQLFLQSPLIGHGTASFEILGPGYREAHSLFYTVLAEQGLIGIVFVYGLYFYFLSMLFSIARLENRNTLLLVSLVFYLAFNHTVGSVFVILPAKSVTVNCIAPVLLICIYFYAKSLEIDHFAVPEK
ncbi:O-antigen ligase [Dyadobacter sp. CY326]|uniref:O-antigen ligase family protein n=1 Tax=Dyadobacter sp. CY326 TaxID=2907300 RepID=UPI001F2F6B18|nr:O-antigen ligase family protein [Dyadobacter sp. CY326]MCE7068079.1 O-antigen ligase family protein [Dyadobacter sp. CY326]